MINVGVCDDELYYREKIKKLVEYNFNNMGDVEVNTVLYSSGEELCKDQQFLKKCEILFLDINMQESNGIEVAYKIKKNFSHIYLVFITAYLDYVLVGYHVEAFRFLLKDNLEQQMRECIPALLMKIKRENFIITCQFLSGEKKINIRNVIYIESFRHKMCFHMNDEQEAVYEKNGNLSELEKMLEKHGFCRIHKSFLVNMRHVHVLERYFVRMENGIELPIPREKYQKVRAKYFEIVGEV